MEYLNDSQAQYADKLVEKFKESVFSCWYGDTMIVPEGEPKEKTKSGE